MSSTSSEYSSQRGSRDKHSRARQPPKSLHHVFRDGWTDDWVEIANNLCGLLELPDLTTRSGLKKVHSNLPYIQQQLDDTFKFAKRSGHTKIMGGVVAVYTKMCTVDGILQDKIIADGFYDRLVNLIASDDTRRVALRALNTLSLTNGKSLPSSFLKGAPAILRLALRHLDDPDTLSIIVSIFAHSSLNLQDLGPSFDVEDLCRTLVDALKESTATHSLFSHAMICFKANSYKMIDMCGHIPSFVTLHIALLHSNDYSQRIQAVSYLSCRAFKLNPRDEAPVKNKQVAPRSAVNDEHKECCTNSARIASDVKLETLPPRLLKATQKYGREKTQIAVMQRARSAFASLFLKYSPDTELLEVGRRIADLILRYQHPLPDVLCPCCGSLSVCAPCRAKRTWPELVQKCINALRGQSPPSQEDVLSADILQWKLECDKTANGLIDYCKPMTSKHPRCPLFYYIPVSILDIANEDLLQLAKKGLKCPDIPDWLRFELHRAAADSAFSMALSSSWGCCETISYAFMQSARADAKILLDEAPPDDIHRCFYLSVYIMSHFALEGSSVNLSESSIKYSLKQMDINREFNTVMGEPFRRTGGSIGGVEKIRSLLPEALKEWTELLERMDAAYLAEKADGDTECHADGSDERDGDALNLWMRKFEDEGGDGGEGEKSDSKRATRKIEMLPGTAALMTCSWCGQPSAVLKKCGGCGKERYCDSECQKHHWKTHKTECQSTEVITTS